MMMQETLFDSLEPTDQIYNVGDVVHYVILDVVKKCMIEWTFECKDRRNPYSGPTVRYSAVLENGCGHTFGKYDVGESIFDSREEAESKGARNLAELGVSVVRAESIVPDEYVAYEDKEVRPHMKRTLYGCCALVGGTMVYRKGCHTYHFLDEYNGEKAARKAYRKELAVLKREFSQFESADAVFEAEDCYGVGDGHWSACEYAYNNWYGGLLQL